LNQKTKSPKERFSPIKLPILEIVKRRKAMTSKVEMNSGYMHIGTGSNFKGSYPIAIGKTRDQFSNNPSRVKNCSTSF
jgi:NAD/NADP transhydrogenase beta subunit